MLVSLTKTFTLQQKKLNATRVLNKDKNRFLQVLFKKQMKNKTLYSMVLRQLKEKKNQT